MGVALLFLLLVLLVGPIIFFSALNTFMPPGRETIGCDLAFLHRWGGCGGPARAACEVPRMFWGKATKRAGDPQSKPG